MYPIWINDGKNPAPTSRVYYALAANGIFIQKQMPFWKALVPVQSISTLEELQPQLELYLPPIPETITRQIAEFFAWVWKNYCTESMVVLWWSPTTKTYRVTAPVQRVSQGHINYDMPDKEGEEVLIGTFHSHGDMSAFHSSTDKCDEASIDGIHGTFGNFSGFFRPEEFSLSLQAAINGERFVLDPLYWLEGVEKDRPDYPLSKKSTKKDAWPLGFASIWRPNTFKLKSGNNPGSFLPDPSYVPPAGWADKISVEKWYWNDNKENPTAETALTPPAHQAYSYLPAADDHKQSGGIINSLLNLLFGPENYASPRLPERPK